MDNFLEVLKNWDNFNFHKFFESCTELDIINILNKEYLNDLDFLTLLSPIADNYLEEIAQVAQRITTKEFGKIIQIYTPLYLSNYCQNKCIYCGFNVENRIERIKLSDIEIISECKKINDLGIRHILLLTGGDRVNSSFLYLKNAVEIVKNYFDSISIEVYSLTAKEYKILRELGVDNITLYQETYNKERYKQVHLAGEKSNYNFRINAPERAAKSNIKSINLGVLLGLDDPLKDFFLAGMHSNYIKKNYPSTEVAISVPRLKECLGGFKSKLLVTDKMLAKFIMAYRIFIPKGGISLSTRENANLRDNFLPLGITKMSAESKTNVGGHVLNSSSKQFETSDNRTVELLHKDLINYGYQPVYKDWFQL